jgi:hypothetical protein
MGWTGYDTRVLIYGRNTDPTIATLEIDFGPESRLFPARLAGYVIVMDDPPGESPQCWRFLDAAGEAVHAPAGPG